MANTNDNDSALQWSGSGSKSLNSTSRFDSDAKTIHADAHTVVIQITCDNSGTPAAGDYVDHWLKWSADASTYDTDEHAEYLGRMDTYGSNDPGEDPCTKTYEIAAVGKQAYKLTSKANQGGTRAVTVSAIHNEARSS